jgi:threonine/homoserine/homoserine lactone efflux protein
MEVKLLMLFFLTVIPLICTPGPDILFIVSQGISKGQLAAVRAVSGLLLGLCSTRHPVRSWNCSFGLNNNITL